MRQTGPLTDSAIRKAKPGQKLSDNIGGRGRMILVVTAVGRKGWHFREQTARRDRSRKLGEYPTMALPAAREAAREFSSKPDAMRKAGTFGDPRVCTIPRSAQSSDRGRYKVGTGAVDTAGPPDAQARGARDHHG